MIDAKQLALVEEALAETDNRLRRAAASPAVRELRVRHGFLQRVVRGWVHAPPHPAQVAAMLECAVELRGQVVRACGSLRPGAPTVRPPPARTTRPPPRRDGGLRTTRPPPARRGSDAPPSTR